jgi:hypothetical protein
LWFQCWTLWNKDVKLALENLRNKRWI